MPISWRFWRPAVLASIVVALVLPLAVPASFAQEDGVPEPVIIQGTPELEQLVGAIRDAYQAAFSDADVQIDPRGGQRGAFDALCDGTVDIVMSTAPISDSQIAVCNNQGVDFVELLLAYEAIVMVATPEADVTCAPRATLEDIWQSGAVEDVTWADLGADALDTPVAFYGPVDTSPISLLWRSLVPAGELREDIVTTDELVNILTKVAEEGSSALGFISLADYEASDVEDKVPPMEIENEDGDCVAPSVSSLENGSYPLGRASYLYIGAASAERPEVRSFVQFALADEAGAATIVPEQGFTSPSPTSYEYGLNNLLDGKVGRTFSRPFSPVSVSTSAIGTVLVVGAPALNGVLSPIRSEFETRYVNATIDTDLLGNSAGWQAFCSGEADVLQATREPNGDEQALCAENGIDPYLVDLGAEALVVVVPEGNDWLDCLTGETAAAIFRAGTEEEPAAMTWQAVNPDWPETTILAVVPPLNTGETDLLTYRLIDDLSFVMRTDGVENGDPLYRAQGVANTVQDEENPNNAITYLYWSELQQSEAAVRAVPLGEACVAPDEATISDGSYPLAYPVRYYFSRASYENVMLRAFLWHFFDLTSLDEFAALGYVGLDVDLLGGDQRDALFDELTAYEEAAAQAAAEAAEAEASEAEASETEETEPAEDTEGEDVESGESEPDAAESYETPENAETDAGTESE
jgi:phosphate transport system substrate-binding protein